MEYIPDRGHLIWLNFTPQQGHEQAGRRPAIVISPGIYNKKTGLALLCPITSQIKHYPFEVLLPSDLEISGVVLSDQLKSLDWRARNAEFICEVPNNTITEILSKIKTLLQ